MRRPTTNVVGVNPTDTLGGCNRPCISIIFYVYSEINMKSKYLVIAMATLSVLTIYDLNQPSFVFGVIIVIMSLGMLASEIVSRQKQKKGRLK